MIKKILLLSLCITMLGGCSKGEKKDADYLYFLFATPLKEHAIWLQAKAGFDDACDKYKIRCDWKGPTNIDTKKMEEEIQTGILQKVDGIITQGVISDDLIKEATQNDIPVFLVDSDMPESERFGFMGKNFTEQADILLADIEKRYGENQFLQIAIQVAEGEFKIAQDQITEIRREFTKHPGGFEIVSISESKSDKVRAKREWESVLSNYPEINVAINFAAEGVESCGEIAELKAHRDKMIIYGVDDMPITLRLIKEGKIDASVVINSFYDYGYQSVKMLYEYKSKGIKPKHQVISPYLIIVDKDNVNHYKKDR
ncbi:MAG: substrate-binding domain-containing protein [Longicatena sp.]